MIVSLPQASHVIQFTKHTQAELGIKLIVVGW